MELALSTGFCITLCGSVLQVLLLVHPSRQRVKALVGEGVGRWMVFGALMEGKNPITPPGVHPDTLVCFSFLKEQTEKWSFPQRRRLSKATTPQSSSTQVSFCLRLALGTSVPDLMGTGWWGGLCQGLAHLVSRPKSPKPLPQQALAVMQANSVPPTALVQHGPALPCSG